MTRQASGVRRGAFTWQTESQDTYDSYGRVDGRLRRRRQRDRHQLHRQRRRADHRRSRSPRRPPPTPVLRHVTTTHVSSQTLDPTRGPDAHLHRPERRRHHRAVRRARPAHQRLEGLAGPPATPPTSPTPTPCVHGLTRRCPASSPQTLNDGGQLRPLGRRSTTRSAGSARPRPWPPPRPARPADHRHPLRLARLGVEGEHTTTDDSSRCPRLSLVTRRRPNDQSPTRTTTSTTAPAGRSRTSPRTTPASCRPRSPSTTATPPPSSPPSPAAPRPAPSRPAPARSRPRRSTRSGRPRALTEYTANPTLTIPSNTFTGTFYDHRRHAPPPPRYGYDAHGQPGLQVTAGGAHLDPALQPARPGDPVAPTPTPAPPP